MEFLYNEILEQYDFKNPKVTFLRHSENLVYQIVDDEKKYILRIHKPIEGFSLKIHQRHHTKEEYIEAEMQVLYDLHQKGNIKIQTPFKNKNNKFVSFTNDNTPVTILTYLEGSHLKLEDIDEDLCYKLGEMLAIMHNDFNHSNKYKRYIFDQELIEVMNNELIHALTIKNISKHHFNIIKNTLDIVKGTMEEIKYCRNLEFMHADLGLSNIIKNNNSISPIDFSFCGYGYKELDITSLLANFTDPQYRKLVIDGYESTSNTKLNIKYLEVFFAFGLTLYITTQHNRMSKEPWFLDSMKKWEETIFNPLIENRRYLLEK